MIKKIFFVIGVLASLLVLVVLIVVLVDLFGSSHERRGLSTGSNNISAQKDSTLKIAYTDPSSVEGSPYYYMAAHYLQDDRKMSYKEYGTTNGESVNYIFLDSDFNVLRKLLDKKAIIYSSSFPGSHDTIQKKLGYLIAFEDSNKDGLLNAKDFADLYLSNLDGSELLKVTSEIEVLNYYFLDPNRVFIEYRNRQVQDKKNQKRQFAVYSIKEKNLRFLTGIDEAVKDIESIIKN